MNIGQLDGQPLALQIFNGMTAESTCVNERWAKDQLFRCVCFAGGRHQTILDETVGPIFQSPSSVWRTTWTPCPGRSTIPNFNPRPPCGGRRLTAPYPYWGSAISIHVLRVEDDVYHLESESYIQLFQSTSSVWRTTAADYWGLAVCSISIHVLRVEDDAWRCTCQTSPRHFNPRPPCGGRLADLYGISVREIFQSTSSVWRTTKMETAVSELIAISIHVLRVEDDKDGSMKIVGVRISIHVLRVEDDRAYIVVFVLKNLFQSTSSVWRTTVAPWPPLPARKFQSTSSVWRTTHQMRKP